MNVRKARSHCIGQDRGRASPVRGRPTSVDRTPCSAYHHLNLPDVAIVPAGTPPAFESAMSTEQKPAPTPNATQPKSEPNALASGLASGWDKFKQGKLISYPVMALILVLVTAIGVGWWITSERRKAEAQKWIKLDGLTSVNGLEEYAKENPNTMQGKVATLEIARLHLGQEGIERMSVKDTDIQAASAEEATRRAGEIRDAAVANVEKAREEFTKLVDDFKDDPVIRVECMYACAKAEAVLVGIPKPGQLEQRRGNPAKAIEWLDKVSEAAPDTEWGKSAKKLADVLRNQNTKEQVETLQSRLFELAPTLPPFNPKMPKDAAHGFPPP
jgi:hypothetical protein